VSPSVPLINIEGRGLERGLISDTLRIEAVGPQDFGGGIIPAHFNITFSSDPFSEIELGRCADEGGCQILERGTLQPATTIFWQGPRDRIIPLRIMFQSDTCEGGSGQAQALSCRRPRDVPGPVVGAGLPGFLAACVGLLAWWRRRQKIG
jgi:hypothetical protein